MPNKLSKSTILHTNIIDLNFLLPKRGLLVKAGGIRDFLPVIVEEAERPMSYIRTVQALLIYFGSGTIVVMYLHPCMN